MKLPESDKNSCPISSADRLVWKYKCLECGCEFQMPVPKGPTDERSRTCPVCQSHGIERVNIEKTEVCPPGG